MHNSDAPRTQKRSGWCKNRHIVPLFKLGRRRDNDVKSYPREEHIGFYELFWIFFIVSFVGLVIETIVSYPIDGMWKDRAGYVWGPLSPIYGVGALLLTLILHPFRHMRPGFVFIIAALTGGGFELLAGWFFKHMWGIVAWSYADQPFNIGGYTCLGIAIVWGGAGVAWMYLVMPRFLRLLHRVPRRVRVVVTAIAFVYIFADSAYTITALTCWYERMAGIPITDPVQQFFALHYNDAFMQERFQTMSLYPQLVTFGK